MNTRRGLSPIDQASVLRAVETNFAATYLAILGISQNVVLGILIFKFAKIVEESGLTPFLVASGLVTLLILVLVWHSYQWYPYLNRWFPGWRDSSIPFFLGASQGFLAMSVGSPLWFFRALLLLAALAIFGYLNTGRRIRAEDFEPGLVHTYQVLHLQWSGGVAATLVAYSAFMGFFYRAHIGWWTLLPVLFGVVGLFAISGLYQGKILNALGIADAI